ncbi:MAG: hypothetical protein IIA00_04370 [Proteobacteria bacterium]|nr:hypothetical protein [Pseudomonadota bacterium]
MAEVYGVRMAGVTTWILRRGVYLANFPTLHRKIRVLFEWIWVCLFPADIAHLSLSRTTDLRSAGRQSDEAPTKRR